MEKKIYEVPELEVLDMNFEGALLADSDYNTSGGEAGGWEE